VPLAGPGTGVRRAFPDGRELSGPESGQHKEPAERAEWGRASPPDPGDLSRRIALRHAQPGLPPARWTGRAASGGRRASAHVSLSGQKARRRCLARRSTTAERYEDDKRSGQGCQTTRVIWVRKDTSFQELAVALRAYRVSAFPVLDDSGTVTGVVSEPDMLTKEAVAAEEDGRVSVEASPQAEAQAVADAVHAYSDDDYYAAIDPGGLGTAHTRLTWTIGNPGPRRSEHLHAHAGFGRLLR
jgi:hypothetical protein